MIQANELRIGNWFEVNGNYWQASFIEKGSDAKEENPIPLTPEILEKCGITQLGMNKFTINKNGWDLSCVYDCKYLHQLQNLYFALTGEELEINFHATKENSIS